MTTATIERSPGIQHRVDQAQRLKAIVANVGINDLQKLGDFQRIAQQFADAAGDDEEDREYAATGFNGWLGTVEGVFSKVGGPDQAASLDAIVRGRELTSAEVAGTLADMYGEYDELLRENGEDVIFSENGHAPEPQPSTWADTNRVIGPIVWDWRDWLPRGLLGILVSEQGTGKSALALRVAGSYLKGWDWPDGTPFEGETGAIVWCESEAAQAINLARAKAWGLPLERILNPIQPLDDFRLPVHLDALWAVARRNDVRAIFIDSLRGAVSGDENASQVISATLQLAELARDLKKPIQMTHHLRKRGVFDGDDVNLDRVRGSSAITQPARVVWSIDAPDPMDKQHRRLSVIKSNLAPFPEPLGLRIDESGVTFGPAPNKPQKYTSLDQAKDFLLDLLVSEPQPATYVKDEYEGAGLSRSTINRAKTALGVTSLKRGDTWMWSLPVDDVHQDTQGRGG